MTETAGKGWIELVKEKTYKKGKRKWRGKDSMEEKFIFFIPFNPVW